MNNKARSILLLAAIGGAVGFGLAQYKPDAFSNGLKHAVRARLSEPFDEYRNNLAFRWGVYGAAAGAVIGVAQALFLKK